MVKEVPAELSNVLNEGCLALSGFLPEGGGRELPPGDEAVASNHEREKHESSRGVVHGEDTIRTIHGTRRESKGGGGTPGDGLLMTDNRSLREASGAGGVDVGQLVGESDSLVMAG